MTDDTDSAGWRPIGTAPKDGTEVDLWADGERKADSFWGVPSFSKLDPPTWVQDRPDLGHPVPIYDEPTHWRPKPPPPTDELGTPLTRQDG